MRRLSRGGDTLGTMRWRTGFCLTLVSMAALALSACGVLPGSAPAATPTSPAAAPTAAPAAGPSPSPKPAAAAASPAASPAAQATSTAAPTTAVAPANTVYVGNTDGEGVFLRNTPVMDDKAKAYPDGTALTIIGDDVDGDGQHWKHVKTPDGEQGYVPSQYTTTTPP